MRRRSSQQGPGNRRRSSGGAQLPGSLQQLQEALRRDAERTRLEGFRQLQTLAAAITAHLTHKPQRAALLLRHQRYRQRVMAGEVEEGADDEGDEGGDEQAEVEELEEGGGLAGVMDRLLQLG